MSITISKRVFDHSEQTGTHRLAMLAIAEHADDDGVAWPSVGKLARMCRTTPRNVNLVLAKLKASGELEVRIGEGRHGCNLYRVLLDPLKPASPLKGPSPLKRTSSPPEAAFSIPLKPASPEPSLNHQEPPALARPALSAKGKATKAKPEHPLFAEFYAAYPRKAARPAALNAFSALNPDRELLRHMLAAIAEQQRGEQWCRDGGQFIPHPASWLNGRRWEDQLTASTRAAGLRPVLHAEEMLTGAE